MITIGWNNTLHNMAKRQKRFQFWGYVNGKPQKLWTEWFDYYEDNGQLHTLQTEERWQLKNKLLNEFRVI